MSDMPVREIKPVTVETYKARTQDLVITKALALEIQKSKVSTDDCGVVFEPPKTDASSKEKATPTSDSAGRSKWIITGQCWCADNASTDCRYHSRTERGWETCPSKELSGLFGGRKKSQGPRNLWATNPDFGRPRAVLATPEGSDA